MSFCWIKKKLKIFKDRPISDWIQIGILSAIFVQAFFLMSQTNSLKDHFKIQQRPIVGVSEIKPVVLGDRILQSEIVGEDELLIHVIFKNIGVSPAFIRYLKVKIYYGYFFGNKENPSFGIRDLCGGTLKKNSFLPHKEVSTKNVEFSNEVVLFPNQTTEYTTMVAARELMDQIREYTTSREAPILIECEASYTDINKSDQYWHNCIYELQWPLAKHITIYSSLIKSNADDKPIHLTNGQLYTLVAHRQNVESVIDASKPSGKEVDQITNSGSANRQD